MKKSSKKSLEKRGIVVAGRAQNAPSAQFHDDKRREVRGKAKQRLKLEFQRETARNRGPFPFLCRSFLAACDLNEVTISQSRWRRVISSR